VVILFVIDGQGGLLRLEQRWFRKLWLGDVRLFVLPCVLITGPLLAQGDELPSRIAVKREMADLLARKRDYVEAIRIYRELLSQHPRDNDVTRGLALALMATRQHEEAARLLEKLTADRSSRTLADVSALVQVYCGMGRKAEARRLAREVTSWSSSTGDDKMQFVHALLEIGAYAQAETLLPSIPTTPPTMAQQVLELKADLMSRQGRHLESSELYARLVKDHPERTDVGWQYVSELVLAGMRTPALAHAKRLVKRSSLASELVFVAELCLAENHPDQGEAYLDRIPPADRTVTSELIRGEIALKRNDWLRAREVFDRAFSRFPKDRELARALAGVLVDTGEPERGLSVLEPLLSKKPNFLDLQIGVRAHRLLGHRAEAHEMVLRILRLPVAGSTERLERSEFFLDEQETELAAQTLESAGAGSAGAGSKERWRLELLRARLRFHQAAPESGVLSLLMPLLPQLPSRPTIRLPVVEILLRFNEEEKALSLLEGLTGADPTQGYQIAVLKARALWGLRGDRVRVEQLIAEALALRPPWEGLSLDLAELLLDMDEPEKAQRLACENRSHLGNPEAVLLTRARVQYLGLNNPAMAKGFISKLVSQPPEDPSTRLDAVEFLVGVGEREAANCLVSGWIAPRHLSYRAGRLSASLLIINGHRAKAHQELVRIACEQAPTPLDRLELASVFMRIPDPKRALTLLQERPLPATLIAHSHALVSEANLRLGRFSAAEAAARRITEDQTMRTRLPESVIKAFIDLRLLDTAVDLWRRLPASRQKRVEAMKALIHLYLAGALPAPAEDGRGEAPYLCRRDCARAALEVTDSLRAFRPNDLEIWRLRGEALMGMKRHAAALTLYESLLKTSDDDEDLVLGRCQALNALGRSKEAQEKISSFAAAQRRLDRPLGPMLFSAWAESLSRERQFDAALGRCDEAIRLGPKDPQVVKDRAGILAARNWSVEALSTFRRALDMDANKMSLEDHVALAELLGSVGRRTLARQELDLVFKLDPDNLDAKAALAGILADQYQTRQDSLRLFREVLSREPSSSLRTAYASAIYDLLRHERSSKELRIVEKECPDDLGVRHLRALLDLELGFHCRAERTLRQMNRQSPGDFEIPLGLAQVASMRAPCYLREQIRETDTAWKLARTGRKVKRDHDRLFRPGLEVEYDLLSASDTQNVQRLSSTIMKVYRPGVEARIGTAANRVARFDQHVAWTDLETQALWSPRDGTAVRGRVVVGDGGVGGSEILPSLELCHRTRGGTFADVSVKRSRVMDSPDALSLSLKSDTVQAMVGQDLSWLHTSLRYSSEHLDDENSRTIWDFQNRFTLSPKVSILAEVIDQRSSFEPQPFELYFAPFRYVVATLGAEYRSSLLRAFDFAVGGNLVKDRLDGNTADGYNLNFMLHRRMGDLAGLRLFYQYDYLGAARRIDQAVPFHQQALTVAYNTKF